MELTRVLHAGMAAPGQARDSLAPLEGALTAAQLDDLRLAISELVTNSVQHAGLREGDPITLSVQASQAVVRVEVIDRGCGFGQTLSMPTEGHGWGLLIVERLSDRWGHERTSETKVWAEFRRR